MKTIRTIVALALVALQAAPAFAVQPAVRAISALPASAVVKPNGLVFAGPAGPAMPAAPVAALAALTSVDGALAGEARPGGLAAQTATLGAFFAGSRLSPPAPGEPIAVAASAVSRPSPRSKRASLTVAALASLFLSSCMHFAAGAYRPAEPLPAEIAARYEAFPVPDKIEVTTQRQSKYDLIKGKLPIPGSFVLKDGNLVQESIPFEYYKPHTAGKQPLVVLLPILGGGYDLERIVANSMAKQGLAVMFVLRYKKPLPKKELVDPAAIESFARNMVSGARALVSWAVANQDANGEHIGLVGISMGGFLGTSMLAVDSRVSRAVLLLAGADMADIIEKTAAPELVERIQMYEKLGMTRQAMADGLRREVTSDPIHMGRYVDRDKVLLIRGVTDNVVPRRNSRKLWRVLGRPERIDLLTGHYTSVVLLPWVLPAINGKFKDWVIAQAQP